MKRSPSPYRLGTPTRNSSAHAAAIQRVPSSPTRTQRGGPDAKMFGRYTELMEDPQSPLWQRSSSGGDMTMERTNTTGSTGVGYYTPMSPVKTLGSSGLRSRSSFNAGSPSGKAGGDGSQPKTRIRVNQPEYYGFSTKGFQPSFTQPRTAREQKIAKSPTRSRSNSPSPTKRKETSQNASDKGNSPPNEGNGAKASQDPIGPDAANSGRPGTTASVQGATSRSEQAASGPGVSSSSEQAASGQNSPKTKFSRSGQEREAAEAKDKEEAENDDAKRNNDPQGTEKSNASGEGKEKAAPALLAPRDDAGGGDTEKGSSSSSSASPSPSAHQLSSQSSDVNNMGEAGSGAVVSSSDTTVSSSATQKPPAQPPIPQYGFFFEVWF